MLAECHPEWSKCTGKLPAYRPRLRWKKFLINSDTHPKDACVCLCTCVFVLQQTEIRRWIPSVECVDVVCLSCLQSFGYFSEYHIVVLLIRHYPQSQNPYSASETPRRSIEQNLSEMTDALEHSCFHREYELNINSFISNTFSCLLNIYSLHLSLSTLWCKCTTSEMRERIPNVHWLQSLLQKPPTVTVTNARMCVWACVVTGCP